MLFSRCPRYLGLFVLPLVACVYDAAPSGSASEHVASTREADIACDPNYVGVCLHKPLLTASESNDHSVTLHWWGSQADPTTYFILRNSVNIGSTSEANNTFVDTGLKPSTFYTYDVCAYYLLNNEYYCSSLTAATTAATPPPAFGPPTNLSGFAVGPGSISIQWTLGGNYRDQSIVRNGGGFNNLQGIAWNATSFVDNDPVIKPGTVYQYQICGINAANTASACSNPPITIRTPPTLGVQSLPLVYPTTSFNDRYWHDSSGTVYHQNQTGAINQVVSGASGLGAASSVASYSYPFNGQTAWYLDKGSPRHLRQLYTPAGGGTASPSDWGTAPAGCEWSGNPAVSSWGEGRADLYVNALCGSTLRLFHETWENGQTYGWMDISPPGAQISSSPAAVSLSGHKLDVIVMNSGNAIVHGSCRGACDGAAFTWDAPSPRMCQAQAGSACSPWFGEVALGSPTPGVLRAFGVDFAGNIDFSDSSTAAPAWTSSANWYSPPAKCQGLPGGPAVMTSSESSLFVACTTPGQQLYGGWGDKSLNGSWWYMAGGVVGGAGLSGH